MARWTPWLCGPLGVAVLAAAPANARAETIELPTFDVVATTPLGGGEIDAAKVPGSVWRTGAADIQSHFDSTVTQTLAREAPGVTVGNVSGNDFQPDVSYRGFDATPVSGRAQGLAVYQNGVRVNEAFGDTVNWDLIAANAIDRMTLVAGDPIYGLKRPRRRAQRDDEERLHLAGPGSRRSRRLIRARAGLVPVRQAGRRLCGLCRRRGDQ